MNNNLLDLETVDIHADDYAYSLNTSKDMLECMKQGKLSSISIICNTVYFDKCMDLFYKEIPNLPFLPKLSIHLDLPEGLGVSGLLPLSWGKLFLNSYSFKSNDIKNKLKEELRYQINKTQKAIDKCINIAKENGVYYKQKSIRLDSHIHSHPVPVVWKALIEVIEEDNLDIEYIRNPKEPILPFLKHISLIPSYGLINMIKNRILMFYSGKIDKYCDLHKIDKMYMWGLMMSGHMDYDRIKALYDDLYKYSLSKNRRLELLFHPGKASDDEYSDEMNKDYFKDANSSDNRHIEKDAVMRIDDIIFRE